MKRYFRGEELIDREDEIKFFLKWFDNLPKQILWVYGPKSSGKTTLIEYIVENELHEDFWNLKPKGNYWVKYLNLRRKLISSYETFLEAFIKPESDKRRKEEKLSARISAGIFEIKGSILNEVKERKKDLFDVLLNKIEKIAQENKQPILIIDEIQTLEEIYINGDRELLKEFLNFCVALTKETHLSHVVILSSNTVFIDQIYNDSKLKKTSEFYKIDHLGYDTVRGWLVEEGFVDKDIELIWEYLGGCIYDIQKLLRDRKNYKSLKEYLDKQAFSAYAQIINILCEKEYEKDEDIFREIIERIVRDGVFKIDGDSLGKSKYMEVVKKWAEKEIFFFAPETLEVRGNSRIYEKGMERIISKNI